MNSDTFEWTLADDYPITNRDMSNYGSISTETAVFIFGGDDAPPEITKFENMQWSIVGELLMPRQCPFIFQVGNSFHVLGGRSLGGREL